LPKITLYVKVWHVGGGIFSGGESCITKKRQTQRTLGAGDSAAHALRQAFFWLRVFPAPKQNPRPPQRYASRTQAVGTPLAQ